MSLYHMLSSRSSPSDCDRQAECALVNVLCLLSNCEALMSLFLGHVHRTNKLLCCEVWLTTCRITNTMNSAGRKQAMMVLLESNKALQYTEAAVASQLTQDHSPRQKICSMLHPVHPFRATPRIRCYPSIKAFETRGCSSHPQRSLVTGYWFTGVACQRHPAFAGFTSLLALPWRLQHHPLLQQQLLSWPPSPEALLRPCPTAAEARVRATMTTHNDKSEPYHGRTRHSEPGEPSHMKEAFEMRISAATAARSFADTGDVSNHIQSVLTGFP